MPVVLVSGAGVLIRAVGLVEVLRSSERAKQGGSDREEAREGWERTEAHIEMGSCRHFAVGVVVGTSWSLERFDGVGTEKEPQGMANAGRDGVVCMRVCVMAKSD